jgi:hypothetical protein
MSDNFKGLLKNNGLSESSPATKREAAVCAALTLINSKVANSPDRSSILKEELENLSSYVDKIQAALQVK